MNSRIPHGGRSGTSIRLDRCRPVPESLWKLIRFLMARLRIGSAHIHSSMSAPAGHMPLRVSVSTPTGALLSWTQGEQAHHSPSTRYSRTMDQSSQNGSRSAFLNEGWHTDTAGCARPMTMRTLNDGIAPYRMSVCPAFPGSLRCGVGKFPNIWTGTTTKGPIWASLCKPPPIFSKLFQAIDQRTLDARGGRVRWFMERKKLSLERWFGFRMFPAIFIV